MSSDTRILHNGDKLAANRYLSGFYYAAGAREHPEGAMKCEHWRAGFEEGVRARRVMLKKCGADYALDMGRVHSDYVAVDKFKWIKDYKDV